MRYGLRTMLVALLFPLAATPAPAQLDGGARAIALGGAATALVGNAGAGLNPAAAATAGRALALHASEGYGLVELRLAELGLTLPTGAATLALGLRSFGFDDYRELDVGVALARAFTPGTRRPLYAGLQVRFQRIIIPGYGTTDAVALGLGGLVTLRPGLDAGFSADGPYLKPPRGTPRFPQALTLGLAYRPAPHVLVLIDAAKEGPHPLSVRAGLEAALAQAFTLRAGATSAPVRLAFGAGLKLTALTADVAAERHEALGWSPAISIRLAF